MKVLEFIYRNLNSFMLLLNNVFDKYSSFKRGLQFYVLVISGVRGRSVHPHNANQDLKQIIYGWKDEQCCKIRIDGLLFTKQY